MTIVLFGGQGMLGSELFEVLSEEFPTSQIIPLARFNGDITNPQWIEDTLDAFDPNIVINASAFTSVDKAENPDFTEELEEVNVNAPEYMAKWCNNHNATFFHISTDYVFAGRYEESFSENDKPNPINEYGKSKAKGEQKVLKYKNSTVLRTAWLTGEGGNNFVHQMVHLSKNEQSISVIKNEWGSPSFAKDVATTIASLCKTPETHRGKIYHIVNEGIASRKEIVEEIQKFLELSTEIVEVEEFPLPAKRPECSVLKNTLLPPLPHWRDALHRFLQPDLEKLEERRRKKFGKKYKEIQN